MKEKEVSKMKLNILKSLFIVSFVALFLTSSVFAGDIRNVKHGWTKAMVITELGEPTSKNSTISGKSTWVYTNIPKAGLLSKATNIIGHTMLSKLAGPFTISGGVAALESGTEKLSKKGSVDTSTINFLNGIVVSEDGSIETMQPEPIIDSSNIRRSSGNTTSSIKNISGTDKVYSLPNSREVHSSDCTELDNADGLITFPSAKEAKNDGAIPHNCIQ